MASPRAAKMSPVAGPKEFQGSFLGPLVSAQRPSKDAEFGRFVAGTTSVVWQRQVRRVLCTRGLARLIRSADRAGPGSAGHSGIVKGIDQDALCGCLQYRA